MRILIIVMLSQLVWLGCGNQEQRATISWQNGIKLIQNSGKGFWQKKGKNVTFKQVLTIGVEEGDANYMFSKASTLALDRVGNIFIADGRECIIKKINSDGKYLKTIGSKGKGPAEFEAPFVLAFDSDNQLYVADWLNSRINVFDSEGLFKHSLPFIPFVSAMIFFDDSQLVVQSKIGDKIFHKLDQYGRILESFGDIWEAPADEQLSYNQFMNTCSGLYLIGRNLYVSPRLWPDRIYSYSLDGKPSVIISRVATNFLRPQWKGNYISGATAIGLYHILPDLLMIDVTFPEKRSTDGLQESWSECYDFYDVQGNFLMSTNNVIDGFPRCSDNEGNLYFTSNDPFPQAAKYCLQYGKED